LKVLFNDGLMMVCADRNMLSCLLKLKQMWLCMADFW